MAKNRKSKKHIRRERAPSAASLKKRIQRTIAALTPDQFAYNVTVSERTYAVYYFEKSGKPGSIAFRVADHYDGKIAEIAAFRAGRILKDDMFDFISKGIN